MKWLTCVFVTLFASAIFSSPLFSLSVSGVVISEIRLGGSDAIVDGANYKQFVSIHNPGETAIDITGWRLQYAKASYAGGCEAVSWSTEEVLAGSIGVSETRSISYQLTDNAAGSVRIIDAANVVQDVVGWGQAPCFESGPVSAIPQNDKSLVRYLNCDETFAGADSNDNRADFAVNQTLFAKVITSGCTPICSDSQELVGDVCYDDLCLNIDGIQTVVPDDRLAYGGGCQEIILLRINELFPNAIGSDDGLEFIEIWNDTGSDVDLGMYTIEVGSKVYSLADAGLLAAGSYKVLTNQDFNFSMLNTEGVVRLGLVNGRVIDEVAYKDPVEGFAWSLIDVMWRYTNRPTAGAVNALSVPVIDEREVGVSCASNQYRNPGTGRCRQNTATVGSLAPCRDGQYRSEETNRCRNIAQSTKALVPCKEGQYRSEESNRCRSIASEVKALVPCKEGQERNVDTNRCRNSMQLASTTDYKVASVPPSNKEFAGWWIVGIVGVLALGRIIWEWQTEIMSAVKKCLAVFRFKR